MVVKSTNGWSFGIRVVSYLISMGMGSSMNYDARSKNDTKFSSVISGRTWNWQPARSETLVSI